MTMGPSMSWERITPTISGFEFLDGELDRVEPGDHQDQGLHGRQSFFGNLRRTPVNARPMTGQCEQA